MKNTVKVIATLALLIICGCTSNIAEIGKPLPEWHEGELDIHFINTGRGESIFQILPDGTTFLTDASGSLLKFGVEQSDPLPARPSSEISAGKVIADYIRQYSPKSSKGHIDYFLLTHFDGDHIGSYDESLPLHKSGKFRLSSLPEIGSMMTIDKIMDRDYPDYTYPVPSRQDNAKMHNYIAFLEWTMDENGTKVEKWNVGSDSQVMLLNDTTYNVKIRNFSGNGRFWNGDGNGSYMAMPETGGYTYAPEGIPAENALCCSYILSYGNFDFFLGGDLQYNRSDEYGYMDAETPVARMAHKVEVMKANHHGTRLTNGDSLLSVLRPDVWIVNNWRDVQPRPETVDRVIKANPECDIYSTNLPEKNIIKLGERLKRFVSTSGHIVVRVAEKGNSYMIYTLDDTDQNYIVTKISGPYNCTGLR